MDRTGALNVRFRADRNQSNGRRRGQANQQPYRPNATHQQNGTDNLASTSSGNENTNKTRHVKQRDNKRQGQDALEYFHFTRLQRLTTMDSDEAVTQLTKDKTKFDEFLSGDIRPDLFVLTIKVLIHICQANWTHLVTGILSTVCSAAFMKNVNQFLMYVIYESDEEKIKNKLYSNDHNAFWSNLLNLFKKIIRLLPNKACDELMPMLKKVEKIINTIEANQTYKLDENVKVCCADMLRELVEEVEKTEKNRTLGQKKIAEVNEGDPPGDFRELSIIPTLEDLFDQKPFLRKSKVKDAYDSVEHYLDVQFRLVREDFISPLRNGLHEYLKDPTNRRNSDVRVYRNVTLISPDVTKNNVATIISFGIMKNVKWEYSKRFMFGGLVCLSRDNFNTIKFATISDHDSKKFEKGLLSVIPCEGSTFTREDYACQFVMLESKIFFEPYIAVLNTMRTMNQDNFPLEKYIVHADVSISLPGYMHVGECLKYNNFILPMGLNPAGYRWPSAMRLKLDDSQYNAFKSALTHEFSVIQGPPGTGKTYIALKIMEALLNNKDRWREYGPIVVVCYTNHALDQFLEGILPYTKSIVRVGSRSKSEVLHEFMLKNRRTMGGKGQNPAARSVMYQAKNTSEQLLRDMKQERLIVEFLTTPNAIIPKNLLQKYCQDPILLNFETDQELVDWLLGDKTIPIQYNLPTAEQRSRAELDLEDSEGESDDENRDMDNELELNLNFVIKDSDKVILPLEIIDKRCNEVKKTMSVLMMSAQRDENQLQLLQRHIHALEANRASIQKKMAQNPLFNAGRVPMFYNARWKYYWKWITLSHDMAMASLWRLEKEYRQVQLELNSATQMLDLSVLQNHDIVGITTTGAAKINESLCALGAPIVLVEEAAEILEAHVVCSLTKKCKHAILIGDHKQLRPKPAVYTLAKTYNLEVSLFERMINISGNCAQLAHQHRMRPEIAKLICPSIYETLHNHPSVLQYPSVKGTSQNLVFIDHRNTEGSLNDDSWTNPHEAKFLMAFARHLVLQGYRETDITILCTYTGQLFTIQQERKRYHLLKGMRITSVDNYQGEENKIILLSLVRNNCENNIGFLREDNRVCVALSRAREGLFIMGNMANLSAKSGLWLKIKNVLEEQNAIADSLRLQCQIHPDQLIEVRTALDFEKCPEGGCLKTCNADLSCGHTCTSICHVLDRKHEKYVCKEKCLNKCPYDHPCPLLCSNKCQSCRVIVQRQVPSCKHVIPIECGMDINIFPCPVKVTTILPHCNHEVEKPCHCAAETYPCPFPCETRLSCGHSCTQKCHANNDPDHLEYKCYKDCSKKNIGCTKDHQCTKRCFEECTACTKIERKKRSCGHVFDIKCSESVEDISCNKPCKRDLPCGHKCKKLCREMCGGCQVIVEKPSPCGHNLKVKCCDPALPNNCRNPCRKKLKCGHPCTARCKDACTVKCESMETPPAIGLCGHKFSVPCYMQDSGDLGGQSMYCDAPCKTELACKHMCKGTCGSCKRGRMHEICAEDCGNILVCGHQCKVPCREECPPCNELCQVRCRHTRCRKKCGIPCDPCNEPCEWSCPHSKCTKRCSELCDREPCTQPCPKKLKCKHPCIGYCGEPCPPLCRNCNEEEVTELFLGYEDEPDSRFIYLEDCRHCIEVRGLEMWLGQSSGSIQMKTCPRCKTPISKCSRIMNQIKTDLSNVQAVKEKVFGNPKNLADPQSELLANIEGLRRNLKLNEFMDLKILVEHLIDTTKPVLKQKRQILSSRAIEATRIIVDIVKQILEIASRSTDQSFKSFNWIQNQISFLAKSLPTRGQISNQEVSDIERELCRLDWMQKVYKEQETAKRNGLVVDDITLRTIEMDLLCSGEFRKSREAAVQREMKKLSKLDLISERKMIVRAMGFRQGHWYKCPNGHIYAIDQCGGAMEESKCYACGARIGGGSHRLRSDNAVATEMDGATRAAWPR